MTETTYGVWSQAMKASKQHKHVTLRLTKDEARCLIVLAGRLQNARHYCTRFRSFPVYDSLEDEDDETTS
jgi:hypothetical protein